MEARNLGDLLRRTCRAFPDKAAMLVPEDGHFRPISYSELWGHMGRYASALQHLGLQRGDRITIQSENCWEWSAVDWGCRCLGIIMVPIYPTLPSDQTQYIVQDCGSKLCIVSGPDQAAKVAPLGIQTLTLKGEGSITELATNAPGIPKEQLDREIDQASPDDLATIIYTSGTTGPPKGAMLAHRAFTFICYQIAQSLPFDEHDVFLCFLPMSHVYERVVGQVLPLSTGATIAYSKSLMSLGNEMMVVRPTIMLCVPRFLEATMDRIVDGVKKQPPFRQKLFHWALAQGKAKKQGRFAPLAGVLDRLVGAKIRERTGGRIKFFVSGGAALPPHVANFYMAFGLTVLQGYGLTETAAASCVNHPDRNDPTTVGEPILGVEVSIAADGEILIRGHTRMMGYYNLPEATAQAIDAEGWFHTGDIGIWVGDKVKITDRKKDILVLANGKNIAPQPIENKLRESPLIAEAVLFGDGNEYVYALVIPNFDRLRQELGLNEPDDQLVDLPEVKARVKQEVDSTNKTLADFEKVKKHTLVAASFSVDTGELTPSLKVKRKVVLEKFASILDGLRRG